MEVGKRRGPRAFPSWETEKTRSPFIERRDETQESFFSVGEQNAGRVASQPKNGPRTYRETDEAGKEALVVQSERCMIKLV
jgi:hypothetical protein